MPQTRLLFLKCVHLGVGLSVHRGAVVEVIILLLKRRSIAHTK